MAAIAVAPANAADNSLTLTSAAGGQGGPLSGSPVSACLTADDPNFTILESGYAGFIHENLVTKDAAHIVADLSLTFDVRDQYGQHYAWRGSGHLSVDQTVPLTYTSFGMGTATATLVVSMTSSDGATVNVSWPVGVSVFNTSDGLFYGVGFDAAAVTCI